MRLHCSIFITWPTMRHYYYTHTHTCIYTHTHTHMYTHTHTHTHTYTTRERERERERELKCCLTWWCHFCWVILPCTVNDIHWLFSAYKVQRTFNSNWFTTWNFHAACRFVQIWWNNWLSKGFWIWVNLAFEFLPLVFSWWFLRRAGMARW